MGGTAEHPDDASVATGETGHAEVVHLEYDPERIAHADLLATFWECHDPTTPDQQAESLSGQHVDEIATEIQPAGRFWIAALRSTQPGGSSGVNRRCQPRKDRPSTFSGAQNDRKLSGQSAYDANNTQASTSSRIFLRVFCMKTSWSSRHLDIERDRLALPDCR